MPSAGPSAGCDDLGGGIPLVCLVKDHHGHGVGRVGFQVGNRNGKAHSTATSHFDGPHDWNVVRPGGRDSVTIDALVGAEREHDQAAN